MSDRLLIEDMIEACEAILSYTHGLSRKVILSNKEKLHAIYFNFQILGEAANKLSDSVKMKNENIPWRKIISMRHRIVHDYAGVDNIIIIELVENEVPILLAQLKILIL